MAVVSVVPAAAAFLVISGRCVSTALSPELTAPRLGSQTVPPPFLRCLASFLNFFSQIAWRAFWPLLFLRVGGAMSMSEADSDPEMLTTHQARQEDGVSGLRSGSAA